MVKQKPEERARQHIDKLLEGTTLSGVSEQTAKYLTGIPNGLPKVQESPPFSYESTGTENYFRDIREGLRDCQFEAIQNLEQSFADGVNVGYEVYRIKTNIRITKDAAAKTHFMIVDAVGVCENDKTDSRPLERKKSVSFDKLITSIAAGIRDDDHLTSLAGRLAKSDVLEHWK
jgi:hypothetical protein